MIRLSYSNRTEALLRALAASVRAQAATDPLEPVPIVVPNRNMERYVELGLARHNGIAANLRFLRLETFVAAWLADAVPDAPLLDAAAFERRLLLTLLDDAALGDAALAPVRAYVRGAGDAPDAVDLRRVRLALRLARLFEEYAYSRPEMLDAWSSGEGAVLEGVHETTERWQRALFARVRASGPGVTVAEALRAARPTAGPAVHVFGVSYVARAFQWVFDRFGRERELRLYTLNPCREFWEDLPTSAELPRRSERVGAVALESAEDPFGLGAAADPLPLRLWGRPGREHVRLLNEVTECDFEALFEDPCAARSTVLRELQRDVLVRATRAADVASADDDGSVAFVECPSVRRELETVAESIWAAVEDDPTLRFNDFAVVINGADRELYLPQLAGVFHEARRLPHNVVDVPLSWGSRVVEAALLLVDLPFGAATRPDLLAVLTHPAVSGRFPDVDPRAWADLCARLGVFRGVDRSDLAGTYVDRDLLSWDQGLRRVALGSVMTGADSGDDRALEHDGERYFPEEGGGDRELAARFGALARSLLSDIAFARDARETLGRWSTFYQALFAGYLVPGSDAEAADLGRCLTAAAELASIDPDGRIDVSARVPAELLRDRLAALSGGRGQHLADGVVVSSLLPMRAIPFRQVFLTGLGEGRFPASDRRDTIDLRTARRRVGDVTPRERDGYVFLEALLCARDRLVLSWVARDEHTGDPIPPSPVVQDLRAILRAGYAEPGERRVPLRRPADPSPRAVVFAEAARQGAARRAGEAVRAHLAARDASLDVAADLPRVLAHAGGAREELERLLGVVAVPAAGPERRAGGRVSLSALRRFLESPMQGWARSVLGIEREDDEEPADSEDEPFEAGPLSRTIALREVFFDAFGRGAPLPAAYEAVVARLEAAGRWPTGALRERRAPEDLDLLARCRRLGGAALDGGLVRARVGAGPEHLDVGRVLPAIDLDVAGERLRMSGTTEPLFGLDDRERGSVTLVLSRVPSSRADRRTLALRHALRGFLDHVALSALGLPAREHSARVLFGEGEGLDATTRFATVDAARARSYLAAVAADLLGAPHARLMPCEAVLRLADRFDRLGADELHASIEHVRAGGAGSEAYGPVPAPAERPSLPPDEALAAARRRFGLFFELARELPEGA